MFEIPVKYDGVGDAILALNCSGEYGTSFIVKTRSEEGTGSPEWNKKKDDYFYHNLDLDETLHYLPAISEWLGVNIGVEFRTLQTDKLYHTEKEGNINYYMYVISVNNRCLFHQNNMVHAPLFEIRRNVINYIARLVFNYDLIKSKEI